MTKWQRVFQEDKAGCAGTRAALCVLGGGGSAVAAVPGVVWGAAVGSAVNTALGKLAFIPEAEAAGELSDSFKQERPRSGCRF